MANNPNGKKKTGRSTTGRNTTTATSLTQKAVKKKKELTADELLLKAWKKTYANRNRRVDV